MPLLSNFNAIRTNGSSTATQASTANKELLDYLSALVQKKGAATQPERDLITTLINEQLKPGKIQLDDLVQMVFLMLVAGNATMVSMIALGVVTFLQHPLQMAQVRADPKLMSNAVKELCRFHTASALATRRIAIKDVMVGDTLIRTGEGVIAATQSGNRDESVFANPDAFDIHRVFNATSKSLAYGHGQHQCVAEYLALSELEIALNTLFAALPGLQLGVKMEEVKYSPPEADVGISELPVTW
jgi:nitric oxide reductase